MGHPQVDGEIGPLGLVDSWIGYRVLKKKKSLLQENMQFATTNFTTNS